MGKKFDHPSVAEYQRLFSHDLAKDEKRGTVLIRDPVSDKFVPVEQMVAHFFYHLRDQAQTHAGFAVRDCVITVPLFCDHFERQAILDAASIAGFNVLAIINDISAAALFQATQIADMSRPSNYIIYNSGALGTSAALIRFKPEHKVGTVTARSMEIVTTFTDVSLGGDLINDRIAKFLIEKFESEHKGLRVTSGKPYNKVILEAARLKKILNANSKATASLEDLVEYEGLSVPIVREDIDGLLSDLAPRFQAPIQTIMSEARVDFKDLTAILMIGGNSRQHFLLKSLKSNPDVERLLSVTLDPDESVLKGASLYAARLHPSFKTHPTHFSDVLSSGLYIQYFNADLVDPPVKTVELFHPATSVDTTRNLFLKNMRKASIDLFYSSSHAKIASLKIDGHEKAMESLKGKTILSSKLRVPVTLDHFGLIRVQKAAMIMEIEEEIVKNVPKMAAESTLAQPTDPAPPADPEQISENATAESTETHTELVKKEISLPMETNVVYNLSPLSAEEINTSRANIEKVRELEQLKLSLATARNDLENIIYYFDNKLSNPEFVEHSSSKERSHIQTEMHKASELLSHPDKPAEVFLNALQELKRLEEPILVRIHEAKESPLAYDALNAAIDEISRYVQKTLIEVSPNARPQTDAELNALYKKAQELGTWTHDMWSKQSRLSHSDLPVLTAQEMDSRRLELIEEMRTLMSKKLPEVVPPVTETPAETPLPEQVPLDAHDEHLNPPVEEIPFHDEL